LKKYFNFVNDSALRQNESHGDLNPYYIIIFYQDTSFIRS